MEIIYTTDNALDEKIDLICKKQLLKAVAGRRIISVSQRPINFGHNVCIGDIGRSALSMERQVLMGLKAACDDVVAIAEHDCLYSQEYFSFVPPSLDVFWYNENIWALDMRTGLFSFRHRKLMSQLICGRNMLIRATLDKINIMNGSKRWNPQRPVGEPGAADYFKSLHRCKDDATRIAMADYALKYSSQWFRLEIPNIDIKHGGNLTGIKTGSKSKPVLDGWGAAEEIFV